MTQKSFSTHHAPLLKTLGMVLWLLAVGVLSARLAQACSGATDYSGSFVPCSFLYDDDCSGDVCEDDVCDSYCSYGYINFCTNVDFYCVQSFSQCQGLLCG
jgi:hypothetical protein